VRFHLIHAADELRNDEREEVLVITPGGARTALAVPIGALPGFMALLAEGVDGLPAPRCPDCGELVADHDGRVDAT
jgi:hypothetical protein